MKKSTACVGTVIVCGLVIVASIVFSSFISGCASSRSGGVCSSVPENDNSVICRLSSEMSKSPESVASVLKIANVVALSSDLYTAQQANEFVAGIRDFIEVSRDYGLTYADLLAYATGRYLELSPEVQAVFIILEDVYHVRVDGIAESVLTDYDYALILGHLKSQEALIVPFLISR